MTNSPHTTPTAGLSRKQLGLVIAVYVMAFMALLDVFVVILALPTLRTELGASTTQLQWVVGSYSLSLSTFALSAGALADRYGRKRVFLLGVTMFTLGSAMCAAAASPATLLAGRFVQGIGAAIAIPATLTLLALAFPEQRLRARLFGGWATVTGAAAVIGPVLGGGLVETFGWPSIFLINLPLGAITLLLGARCVTESADPAHTALDLPGQLLAILGLGALTYALINVGERGWTAPSTIVALVIAVAGLTLFGIVEWRQTNPMLPLRLFSDRRFSVANLAAATLGFTAFTVQVFLPTYLQQAGQHSVAGTGLMLLPWPASQMIASYLAGRWTARTGSRAPMTLGLLLIASAALGVLGLQPDSPYPLLAVTLVAFGVGVGLTFTPTNAAAMASVPPERSGSGAAITNAVRQTGTSLGIAALGLLFYRADLTTGMHHVALATALAAGLTAVVVLTTPSLGATQPRAQPH
ncbi:MULTISPECIES: MFS transporter [unclassified Mycobacterium]|uniref:MFS transporter n=1 Tax=unclassified Mycobacterium TaxID=2642494 RepID=UPI0029C8E15A|nr:MULTISPECIES: MFS transporter [unclassified Mycobacterium]